MLPMVAYCMHLWTSVNDIYLTNLINKRNNWHGNAKWSSIFVMMKLAVRIQNFWWFEFKRVHAPCDTWCLRMYTWIKFNILIKQIIYIPAIVSRKFEDPIHWTHKGCSSPMGQSFSSPAQWHGRNTKHTVLF